MLISFSGGRTSAYMTKVLIDQNPNAKIVFANTGFEHAKTYEFIENCVKHFGWDLVVLEADVQQGRVGTKAKLTTIKECKRNGEPFEDIVKKYGIPNRGFLHCTRELKIQPIHSWAKANLSKDYQTAIGIRADEIDRMDANFREKRFVYPLVKMGITKPMINEYWENMPFNLDLPEHLGNCVTCWKKSDKKLARIMHNNPEYFELFDRLEKTYKTVRPERGEQFFFRKHRSVEDLRIEFKDKWDFEDEVSKCDESCEVF